MLSRSQRKIWRSLGRRKGREEHGLLRAEGPRLLAELLTSRVTLEHVVHTPGVTRDPEIRGRLAEAARAGATLHEVPPAELAGLADASHPQGVLAVARIPQWDWQDLGSSRILVLDGVQDPGNVGTLVRTAEATGVAGVVTLEQTADPWGPKTIRAAAGSSFRVPVVRASWPRLRDWLADRGMDLWAADAAGETVDRPESVPERLALALGGEAAGISTPVRARASRLVAVPMAPPVESLNVAAAGAILLDRLFAGADGGM